MTPATPNPVSAHSADGSGAIDCWAVIGTSDNPDVGKFQAQNLVRLVPSLCAGGRGDATLH
jgi:hypothetical protein